MATQNQSWKKPKAFINGKNQKCISKSTFIIENLNKICQKHKITLDDMLLYFDFLSRISNCKFGSDFYFYVDFDKDKFVNFFCFDSSFRYKELYKNPSYTAYTRVIQILEQFLNSLKDLKLNDFKSKNQNISNLELEDWQDYFNDIIFILEDLIKFYFENETYTVVEDFPDDLYKKYYTKQIKKTNLLDKKYKIKKEYNHVLYFPPIPFFIGSYARHEKTTPSESELFICFFLVFFELSFFVFGLLLLFKDLYQNRKLYFDLFYYEKATDFGSVFLNLTLPSVLLVFLLIVFYFLCKFEIFHLDYIFIYILSLIFFTLWVLPFVYWLFQSHKNRRAITSQYNVVLITKGRTYYD